MDTVQFPRLELVEASVAYNDKMHLALAELEKGKMRALFMPELVDARIASPNGSYLWQNWFAAPSLRVTGKNRDGKAVVAYAHKPTKYGTANGVKAALPGLRNGAGAMSQRDFWSILDQEDGSRVFVIEYDALRGSPSGVISVEKALEHPQVVPFLGGKERAEKYLARHREVYGKNIGIWHSDDLDENTPRWRGLFLGNGDVNSLVGYGNLSNIGRFVAVRRNAAGGGATKIKAPTLEQVLRVTDEYVPQRLKPELKEMLVGFYK